MAERTWRVRMAEARWQVGGDVAFASLAVLAVVLRFHSLAVLDAPSGIDGGSWLMFGRAIFGEAVRPETYVYPPVIPLLAVSLTAVFGTVTGMHLLASLAAIAPATGLYLALRGHIGWPAAPGCALLLASAAVSDPAAWGGYPQLFGLGLVPLLLVWVATGWADDRRRRRRHGAYGAVLVIGILCTSHLAAAVAAFGAFAVVIAQVVAADGRRRAMGDAIRTVAVAGVAAVPLIPLYLRFAPSAVTATAEPHANTVSTPRELFDMVRFVGRDASDLWTVLAILVPVALVALAYRHPTPPWLLTLGLAAGAAVPMALSQEIRFVYVVPLAGAAALVLVTSELVSSRPSWLVAVAAVTAAVLALQFAGGVGRLSDSRQRYSFLDSASWTGIRALADLVPEGGVVAVASIRGAPIGWWVEGGAQRPTLTASQRQWLFYDEERARAQLADEIVAPPFPTTGSIDRARLRGAGYIAFDPRRTGSAADLAALRRSSPSVFLFDGPGWVVISAG